MQIHSNLPGSSHHTWPAPRAAMVLWGLALGLVHAGCTSLIEVPDQSEFAPLEELAENQGPVARLYIAPTAGVGLFVTHAWFVVKEPDAHTFDRWEVSLHSDEPYGYVRWNIREPEEYFGFDVFVLSELVGEEAREVVDFVNRESPVYPCRHFYLYYPGPNCNTYAQWVLDRTGWDVRLPPTALGKDTPVLCW